MADRVITAEAVISAKDNTGDVFANLARKLQGVGKSAKASAEIDKMTASLERQKQQLAALDKMQATRAKFGDARTRFNAEKAAVESAAKAVAGAVKPNAELTQALARQQSAVKRASAELEKQTKAVLAAKHAAEGFGSPLSKIATDQNRLRTSIESTTRAIEHQAAAERKAADAAKINAAAHARLEREQERRAHGVAHHGIVNYAASGAAAAVSAHGIMSGIERTVHAGADYQHEVVGLKNAGRTPEEQAEIKKRSIDVVSRVPTSSYIENMKVVAETTGAFGSVEHALHNLEFMQKTMSVLHTAGGDKIKGGAGEVGQKMAKFFEERMTDPEKFQDEARAMIPAMVATGGTFNPDEMYNFAQQAKGSLPNYDLHFLSKIAPSLIGANGGERAGTAANAFTKVITGTVNDKKQAEAWEKYGLLDMSKVIKKSGNVVSWQAGAVKDTDLARRDPLKWMETVQLPAMKAHGVDVEDRLRLSEAFATLYRNQNANLFANEIGQSASRKRLHKDEALYGAAGSLEEIYERNLREDPRVGMAALQASIENLMTTVSSPAMTTAAAGLSKLATGLQSVANVATDHPIAAMAAGGATGAAALGGAGYMSYKLLNGFGLGTSAVALDGSAASLTAAAGALTEAAVVSGGKGMLGGLGRAAGVAGIAEGGVVALEGGALATAAALGSLTIAAGGLVIALDAYSKANPKEFRGGAKAEAAYKMYDDINERKAGGHWEETPGRGRAGGGKRRWIAYDEFGATVRESYKHDPVEPDTVPPSGHWEALPRAGRAGGGRRWVTDPVAGPAPFSNPMGAKFHADGGNIDALPRIGGGPTGPIEAKVTGPVTAELKGQAAISVTVKAINADVVSQTSSSSGNIKVSTGGSMPTAKAATGSASAP